MSNKLTATKQALYCILYGFDEEDFWKYEPVGEEGERTLNAMKQIVYNARNSGDSKISSNIEINEKENFWKIDANNRNYISKEFIVSAGANMKDYTINMSGEITEGTKIVDLSNNEKNTFNSGEDFKIIIPIRELEKSGTINLSVNGEVATNPQGKNTLMRVAQKEKENYNFIKQMMDK